MIEVTVKFLGAIALLVGLPQTCITMPDKATLSDLESYLRALGVDINSEEIIVTLNSQGLRQWPADRRFLPGDVVAVFPNITGG